MFITNSYLGGSHGKYKYLFYVLYQDYNETQMCFMKDIDNLLNSFARNLGKDSAVVKPFIDDINHTRQEILDKAWSEDAQREIMNTPGMLMLNVDLEHFNPKDNPWFYFHFGSRADERDLPSLVRLDTIDKAAEVFKRLGEFANASNVNIFEEAKRMRTNRATEALGIFEAKPGVFGFSVDLVKGFDFLKGFFREK